LLSPQKIKAEHLYNKVSNTKPIAFANLFLGIFALIYCFKSTHRHSCVGRNLLQRRKKIPIFMGMTNTKRLRVKPAMTVLLNALLLLSGLFVLFLICLRWYISGHIPFGNGFETMQFLALCILIFAFFFRRKFFFMLPFGFIFSGLVLLLSVTGMFNPQITLLQPVLSTPLLGIHVSVIMIAYTLFGFITCNSIASFLYVFFAKIRKTGQNNDRILQLCTISRIFLYPAVILLAVGIIVGAIWAKISWGRFWGWDPKETWALITLIIYILPLFSKLIPTFRKPLFFHFYMLLAFLSVLMTYFGVNYLLGGLHSYV